MQGRMIEFIAGIAVLTIAAVFILFTISVVSGIRKSSSYRLNATFGNVGGLSTGSMVVVNGVKVGVVNGVDINTQSLRVDIAMDIQSDVLIPEDSTAIIDSADLLGGKIITIKPGHSTALLHPKGIIEKTVDFISLEQRIGDILFLVTNK